MNGNQNQELQNRTTAQHQQAQYQQQPQQYQQPQQPQLKFCKYCGAKIPVQAVICPNCGGQVEELKQQAPQVVINNSNNSSNVNANVNTNVNRNNTRVGRGTPKNKWVAFALCFFIGYFGAHKFYEGNVKMGIIYLFTAGLFGIGWIIDIFAILMKPNPYYV